MTHKSHYRYRTGRLRNVLPATWGKYDAPYVSPSSLRDLASKLLALLTPEELLRYRKNVRAKQGRRLKK